MKLHPAETRSEIGDLLDWCCDRRDRIHYPPGDRRVLNVTAELIPDLVAFKTLIVRPGGVTFDCSQFVYAILLAVGLKPPRPWGYTGTLLADFPHYSDPRDALVGAVVVYGPGTGRHTTITRHADPTHGNPVQCSQGQESDPRMISLLSEAAGQPAPVTMLSIAHLL